MPDPVLQAPMSGDELRALRRRSGFMRYRYRGQLGVTEGQLKAYEAGRQPIPTEIATRARVIDGQGPTTKRVGVARFGDKFVVIDYSLIEEAGRWRAEVLPIVHDDRGSAVIAARDYAAQHCGEFIPMGI